jgi:hypothetical protein
MVVMDGVWEHARSRALFWVVYLMCLAAGCSSGLASLVRLMMPEVEYHCLSDV